MRTSQRIPFTGSGRGSRPGRISRGIGTCLLLLLVGLFPACEEWVTGPAGDPDDVPHRDILELTRTGGDLPLRADGQTQDTLEARLPQGAARRVVTFSTTAGTFRLNGKSDIKVRAEKSADPVDPRLVARAVLVSDTVAKTAIVSASVGEFTRYLEVSFVK